MIAMTTSSSRTTDSTGTTSSTRRSNGPVDTAAEQLTLLSASSLPVQFRLSKETRQRGLAHIAAIRQQLAHRGHAA
jgi:hypothetical protein